jgi:hypothetical protein
MSADIVGHASVALTPEQALAHGTSSTCPVCLTDEVDYELDQSQDDQKWQDASCKNGHAWREIWTNTHIVAVDAQGEELGEVLPVIPILAAEPNF